MLLENIIGFFSVLDILFFPAFQILLEIKCFGKAKSDSISKYEKEPHYFATPSFLYCHELIFHVIVRFWLNTQQIYNFGEIDQQVIENVNLDCGIERILDVEHISFKVIDCYYFAAGIHNPILTHPIIFVVVRFADIIIGRIARGDNFNDEIRRTIAPFLVQFALIANYHNVRLDDCQWVIR